MTTTLAPLTTAETDTDGTSTTTLDHGVRDTHHRLPSVVALARYSGGIYVENAGGLTISDALTRAGLDFTVSKHGPIGVQLSDGGPMITGLPRTAATVATAPGRDPLILGTVGVNYEVVQPDQAAEYGQAILDEGGATVVAACGYGDPTGSRMVLGLRLPEGLKVGGEDPYDLYLFVGNSWNGTTGLWGCVAPIRLACTNQAAATFGHLSNRFSIRHTGSLTDRVEAARSALKISNTFTDHYAAFAAGLLRTKMSNGSIANFIDELLPTPETVKGSRGLDNWDLRRSALYRIITADETNAFGRGTAYGVYQGVVEWADHYSGAKSPASRAARLVDGGDYFERLKIRAAAMLRH